MKAMYKGDERYSKVGVLMDLLGIKDVSTTRQEKNGTIVWRLPIKNNHRPTSFIEVASFKTGYVRNQNSGYSNYQLNKRCMNEPEYFKDYEYNDDYTKKKWTGKYRMFQTRGCKLIPCEIDRLEYLISYCLKNYYIKRANETYSENTGAMARINDLEEKLEAMTEARDYYKNSCDDFVDRGENRIKDLENKLATIQRIADNG